MSTIAKPPWLGRVRFDERGLAPCIVQDHASGDVLMLAWMNAEALERTIDTGMTWFWSRSRAALWNKGATSGALQHVVSLHLDCDEDALLALVREEQPGACHRGTPTCWDADPYSADMLSQPRAALSHLWRQIEARRRGAPEDSYVGKLLAGGVDRVGKKVGEEATEVVIAAKNAEQGKGLDELAQESADLLMHLHVLWAASGLTPEDVAHVLASRRGKRRDAS